MQHSKTACHSFLIGRVRIVVIFLAVLLHAFLYVHFVCQILWLSLDSNRLAIPLEMAPKLKAVAPRAKKAAKAKAPQQIRVRSAGTKSKAKEVYADIAAVAGMSAGQVKSVFDAVRQVALRELRAAEVFVLPNLVTLRLLHKRAADAKVKSMFGKEVHIAAKPARTQVKASALKHMQDIIAEE